VTLTWTLTENLDVSFDDGTHGDAPGLWKSSYSCFHFCFGFFPHDNGQLLFLRRLLQRRSRLPFSICCASGEMGIDACRSYYSVVPYSFRHYNFSSR